MTKLSKEQLQQVKEQLMKQISSLPKDQQSSMKTQIESMNDEQLEDFLIKNKLINIDESGKEVQQSPFRLIVENKLPSYKIAENALALAVLEINPISTGHTIIIPKLPSSPNEISQEIMGFAQILANHLKERLGCKNVEVGVNEILGEAIINLLPIYKDETFDSQRAKVSEVELKELQKKLTLAPEETKKIDSQEEKPKKIEKKRKTPLKKLPNAPKRIP